MSKITNMWWYSSINSNTQIGIIKVHDDITGEDRFYIGTADGINERTEAERIKDYGTPFFPELIK